MIFRVTRSVFARYGRPAIILFAITGPMPGSESRSSALALLISIRPFLLDTVEPVPGSGFRGGAGLGCRERDSSQNEEQPSRDFHRAILSARSKQQFSPAQVNNNEEAIP